MIKKNIQWGCTFLFLIFSPLIYANENLDPDTILFGNKNIKTESNTIITEDPYEDFNRSVFKFNMKFNKNIGIPVSNGYNQFMPDPVKTGISNFFGNLQQPLNMINSFLQGHVEEGLSTFMRFAMNSTFGLLGILDIGTPAGLKNQDEDLGQTLAVWGAWDKSSFIVLPILGPYTTRGLVGGTVDSYYNPVYPYMIKTDLLGRTALNLGGKFVDYTKVAKLVDQLNQQPDPYIFMRESYLQYRVNLIYNGHPPVKPIDDFDFN